MTPVARNIVRTAAPAVAGAVVTFITKATAHVSPGVMAVVFPIATTAYYSAVRFAEKKYPKLGWLLGVLPQAPVKVFPAGTTGVANAPKPQ